MKDSPLTARDFEAALSRLRKSALTDENVGCVAVERCRACVDCTFCKDSQGLVRCHHAIGCVDSSDCTNCTRCRNCRECTRCVDSEGCSKSAFLVRSVACTGCTYCFGCVGLRGKDFHILNEPYDRESYFRVTRALARELGLRAEEIG